MSINRTLIGLALASVLGLAGTAPATAGEQCMPRFIARNIQDAVMALNASRYCEGLPYTIADASKRVDLMRDCNRDASVMIDEMLDGSEERYRNIFTTDPSMTACTAAAAIAIN